jgi:hypothetical protein
LKGIEMPVEIINCKQNEPDWYQARCGIPTASSFQCLMAERGDGKGRATYMRQIAGEIITGLPSESFQTPAMIRGHEMEAEIRETYAFIHGCEPVTVGFLRNGKKGCSPDALIGENGMLEIKSQRPDILIETILKDEFPSVHKAQTQGALLIAERDWIDLAIGYTGMPTFVKRAHRDVQYIVKLSLAIDELNEEVAALVDKIKRYGSQATVEKAA